MTRPIRPTPGILQRLSERRAGFTLLEVMVAAALLGMSLVVMFGFHAQAVRSNVNARRMTVCSYLAQARMEDLMAEQWNGTTPPTNLTDGGTDADTLGVYADLEWPGSVALASRNAANSSSTTLGPLSYRVTWDVQRVDADNTWVRLRVRCTYPDVAVRTQRLGTTISSYRYRDL